MTLREIYGETEKDMKKSLEVTQKAFAGIRTGRASLSLLEGIHVDAYGSSLPLNQVAALSVPENRLITIQPWDQSLISAIERAILKSDLGITPSDDGKIIRLAVPSLTEERRKELVKVIKKMGEEGRVAIRNIRRDTNEELKAQEKKKEISEDDLHKALDHIQELTNRYIEHLEEILAKKEKEILEF
jgi:ribosome recycling factor